jgi:site-specific DNA-methyltransferase (adenine-specific)
MYFINNKTKFRFMGSGSTAVACINTGRNYLGFELDNTYYEVANKRIEDTNYKNKISIK